MSAKPSWSQSRDCSFQLLRKFWLLRTTCAKCVACDKVHAAVLALDSLGGLFVLFKVSFVLTVQVLSLFGISCSCVLWKLFLVMFPESFCNRSALCLFYDAFINDLFDGTCATAPRILAYVSAFSLMWMTFLMYSMGIVLKQMT